MKRIPSLRSIAVQKHFIKGEARIALLLSSLLVLATVGLFALIAQAATAPGKPVYGPETFNRGLYFRFFQVAAPAGQYTLTVQNGNPVTGQNRVDSAVITLSLKTVVGLRDLNAKTASVSKTVTLNKINVLTFLVTGKKGSFITFSINGQTANTPPVANAGADQSGDVGSTITLDGSASNDFNGDLLTYSWNLTSKPNGSTALLTNPNTANPTLFLDKSGSYVGSLVVNDGKVNSTPDTVIVSTLNVPPVADAGSNQRARVNATITLDGSASTDADGNPLTYSWSFASKPTGSTAQLSSTTAVKPTFTVDKPGTYVLQLVVNDGKVNSQAAQVIVTTENSPPVAHAGADQSATINTEVTLDGSASSDVDGDLLTYAWSFASLSTGSTAVLSNSTTVNPTFTVDKPGSYTLQLLVKDGVAESLADTVVITTLNSKPLANAGIDQSVVLNELVSLNGLDSNDADGDVLTYIWTLTARPTGSNATLLNATSAQPSFTADKPGTYVAQLIVNDGTVDSDPATVTISTLNSKPVANAGADQTVAFNSQITLDGTASDDADGDALTYAWAFTSKPQGSTAALTGNTTTTPSFTGDVAGSYVIELMVNDGKEASTADTVTITVETAVPVNVLPTFTSIPITQATEGEGYSYQVTAIDGNSDPLSYALTNNPPQGMAITGTGLITWLPNATQVGDFPITVTVTDGKSPPVEQSFTISVKAATVTVPNVVGLSQAAAQTAITGANLTVGTIIQSSSATVPAGSVISQNPAVNTSVAKNTAVNLIISTGSGNTGGNLPPDPATVAPPIDPTVATTTFAVTQFLYSGNNPIQTGVAQGTIEAKRAAVIRGKVMDKQNNPLSGVTITILNHPEFGQTLSRADGMFDMAVNGGGILTVNYNKNGYLPVQRQVNAPWQDYIPADDVVMIAVDSAVTTITTGTAAPIQVARGNLVTDANGTRRATLMIPAGTTAQVYNPDGTTRTVDSLHVHLTEYTVGANGPESMPAPLPATSGYTYALEISADEAPIKIAGKDVLLSQPAYLYLENFIGFPTGIQVPMAYYDREKAAWIPSPDGKVIKVVSISGGLAELDTDSDNVVDNGATLGITDAERQQLASLYAAGQSLERVPVYHFSTHDPNYGVSPAPGSVPPSQPKIISENQKKLDCATVENRSIIECENQILGERIGILGISQTINYRSDRVNGRKASNTLNIPLSGATVPAPLIKITLELNVGGKIFAQELPPNPNQSYTFEWDGKDSFGRQVQGTVPVSIHIGYVYPSFYNLPPAINASFGGVSGQPVPGNIRARQDITLWQEQKLSLGTWDSKLQDVAGWSLSHHHTYDPIGQVMYQGDGTRRNIKATTAAGIISPFAGDTTPGLSGDGGQATLAKLLNPAGIAVSNDGTVYIADRSNALVRRVGSDGIITTVAGNKELLASTADGIPATESRLINPVAIAVGNDGSLYIADAGNHRVRRIGTDGIIHTLAGTGIQGFNGDGGESTQSRLNTPSGVAISNDGTVYISDSGNQRIRRIGPDGVISTAAGTGILGFSGDGGPGSQARLINPAGIVIASDGSLIIADSGNNRIRRLDTNGIISTIAGTGAFGFGGDGGPARQAVFFSPTGVAIANDGSLYISDQGNARIRRVTSDGIITTVAGTGAVPPQFIGNDGPATRADLSGPSSVAVGPDGLIYIAETTRHIIRKIKTAFPGLTPSDFIMTSEDGNLIYRFASNGRHLSTINALTGATLLRFTYDTNGSLTTITENTEADNLVTTIERDANGKPTAIIAPFGQRTALVLDANGYLAKVTNPANEAYEMTYTADGLLTSFKDQRNNASTLNYDPLGLLLKDTNAVTGSLSLTRNELADGHSVAVATSLNRVTTHTVRNLSLGDRERTHLQPDNTSSTSLEKTNGTTTTTAADGSVTTLTEGPDPRFSMLAPIAQSYSLVTGGRTTNITSTRTAVLTTAGDPLSLASLTDTVVVNGRTSRLVYNQAAKTFTSTSAANRQSTALIDNIGRVKQTTVAGIESVFNTYDQQGRLASVKQGNTPDDRLVNFAYSPQGYLANVTDPIGRQVAYQYDLAGRVTTQTLPDSRQILFGYDAKGNLTSLAPPGKPAHGFTYNAIDQVTEYKPPVVSGSGTTNTLYEYDLDKALTKIIRPDALTLNFTYDNAGRLSVLNTPEGDTTYGYNATTGKLASIAAPGGEGLAYTYNGALLTQTAWNGTISGNVGYAYDNDFRIASVSVNGANPVAYTYDADSLLLQAGALTLARNPQNGLLTGTVLGSVNDSYTYNGFAEMTSYLARFDTTDLYKTEFIRDKLGRITQKTETVAGVTQVYDYGYDTAGRLIEVKRDGLVLESYGYDENGNRTFLNGAPIADYDAQDRLLRYNNITYNYTANGELKSKTIGTATTTYRYDVLGNLREVNLPGPIATQIEYVIDGQNRRIGKKRNGVLEEGFIYQSQLKPVAELDGSGNIVSRFVYGIGVNVPDFMIKGGVTYRFIKDHLGSPRLVVNTATNTVAQRLDYDAWGNVTFDSNVGFQPFGFAGGIYDKDTGLVRFGARDYDSLIGRWTLKDPLRFKADAANLYVYSLNNVLNFSDPDGRISVRDIASSIWKLWNKYNLIEGTYSTIQERLEENQLERELKILNKSASDLERERRAQIESPETVKLQEDYLKRSYAIEDGFDRCVGVFEGVVENILPIEFIVFDSKRQERIESLQTEIDKKKL